jgi:hypothetical protein
MPVSATVVVARKSIRPFGSVAAPIALTAAARPVTVTDTEAAGTPGIGWS